MVAVVVAVSRCCCRYCCCCGGGGGGGRDGDDLVFTVIVITTDCFWGFVLVGMQFFARARRQPAPTHIHTTLRKRQERRVMTRGRSHRKHCRSHVAFVKTRSGTYSQYLLYIIHTKNCFKNSALCSTNISALLASAGGCGRINVACAHCSGAHSRVRALQAMPGTVPGESPRFANDQFYLVPVDSFMCDGHIPLTAHWHKRRCAGALGNCGIRGVRGLQGRRLQGTVGL